MIIVTHQGEPLDIFFIYLFIFFFVCVCVCARTQVLKNKTGWLFRLGTRKVWQSKSPKLVYLLGSMEGMSYAYNSEGCHNMHIIVLFISKGWQDFLIQTFVSNRNKPIMNIFAKVQFNWPIIRIQLNSKPSCKMFKPRGKVTCIHQPFVKSRWWTFLQLNFHWSIITRILLQ